MDIDEYGERFEYGVEASKGPWTGFSGFCARDYMDRFLHKGL